MLESKSGASPLDEAFARVHPYLIQTVSALVRTLSENLPPRGNEMARQEYVAAELGRLGMSPDVYLLSGVEGLSAHPEYWPHRDYRDRSNGNAVKRGSGDGRSLVLSGHIDPVPADTPVAWTRDPFGASIEEGRLY